MDAAIGNIQPLGLCQVAHVVTPDLQALLSSWFCKRRLPSVLPLAAKAACTWILAEQMVEGRC